ncbi:MAG: hypothetical protein GXY52_09400 [Chloroflexi bacterium]|nr:hypothetical protein [Chloroflexota bacterium]
MTRPIRWLLVLMSVLVTLSACQARPQLDALKVGSYENGFSTVAGQVLAAALKAAGYQVTDHTYEIAEQAHTALSAGEIDLCWFDAADVWYQVLGHDYPHRRAYGLTEAIRQDAGNDALVWSAAAPHILEPGLAVQSAQLGERKIDTISQYAEQSQRFEPLRLCVPEEMLSAGLNLADWQRAYRLSIPAEQIKTLPYEQVLPALQQGTCSCALTYRGDTALFSELRWLTDDKHFIQERGYILATNEATLARMPALAQQTDRVISWLNTETVTPLLQAHRSGDDLTKLIRAIVASHN